MSRVFLAGQGGFGAMAADAIAKAEHEIVGVCSPAYSAPHVGDVRTPDNERAYRHDRLRVWADTRGTPWTNTRSLSPEAIPEATDAIVAAHSHAFIGRLTRAQADVCIGYHPSLLPLHRGRDAIRWTIRDGDRVCGGSVYHLTDNVDAGPIAAQDYALVPKGATAQSLWREILAPLGVRLLLEVLDGVDRGVVAMIPQDESLATWEPSMDSPRLHRPELLQITDGTPSRVRFVGGRDG